MAGDGGRAGGCRVTKSTCPTPPQYTHTLQTGGRFTELPKESLTHTAAAAAPPHPRAGWGAGGGEGTPPTAEPKGKSNQSWAMAGVAGITWLDLPVVIMREDAGRGATG